MYCIKETWLLNHRTIQGIIVMVNVIIGVTKVKNLCNQLSRFLAWQCDTMTSSNWNIPALLAICAGNSTVTGECQWRGALMFSLICGWINGWVNNGEADDLRRHRAHYDVTVMETRVVLWKTRPCLFVFINSSPLSATYMRQQIWSALVHIMACRLFGARPLFKPMLGYWQLDR